MRCGFLGVLSFLVSGCLAFGFEKEDLVGDWESMTTSEVEEGIMGKGFETSSYSAEGSYRSDGVFFLYVEQEEHRLLTYGGRDEGTWSVKNGELHVKTNKMELELFISNVEDVSKKDFEETIPELLEEVSVYTVVKAEKDKIVLKDKDDGSETVLTRLPAGEKRNPKAPEGGEEGVEDPTVRPEVKEDLDGERIRSVSKFILDFEGFRFSRWLPTAGRRAGVNRVLRPEKEIYQRLMCNFVVVSWVALPEEVVPTADVKAFVEKEGLLGLMTDEEKEIYATERAKAGEDYLDNIGWKMESMWALAWVLGYENGIDVNQDQIGEETIGELMEFCGGLAKGRAANIRSLPEVVSMEDLFYCTHNAVRSAQTGKPDCVPEGFHPVMHGGIIHEKRHVLTWVLSPKTSWEKTDLST